MADQFWGDLDDQPLPAPQKPQKPQKPQTKPNGTNGTNGSGIDYEEAERLVRVSEPDYLREHWLTILGKIDHPSNSQINDLLDTLTKRSIGQKSALKQDWGDHKREAAAAEAAQQAFSALTSTLGDRARIDWVDTDLESMIQAAENTMMMKPEHKELIVYGGQYCRVELSNLPYQSKTDEEPPKVPSLVPHSPVSMECRLNRSAAIVAPASDTKPERVIAPPVRLIAGLLDNPDRQAPVIQGLDVHPLILPNGEELEEEGYDESSGLYLDFGGATFLPIPNNIRQEEARQAREEIIEGLFGEFQFDDPGLDVDCAVAFLLTSISRRLIRTAPGFLVTASRQGSGKTTLCRMVHAITTGHHLPVMTLPKDPTEASKVILATLLQGAHAMCLDNIADGATLSMPILAQIITSEQFQGRVLGETRSATTPTNVMISATGNNVTVDADLARRLIRIQLSPTDDHPEQIEYEHQDVMAHCLRIRQKMLRAGLTIVAGYLRHKCPHLGVPSSGMPEWDRMVRLPLIWCGGADPVEALNRSKETSPILAGRTSVLLAGRQTFADREVTAAQILDVVENARDGSQGESMLRDAISEMSDQAKKSARALGRLLSSMVGHPEGDLTLSKRIVRGRVLYKFGKRNH